MHPTNRKKTTPRRSKTPPEDATSPRQRPILPRLSVRSAGCYTSREMSPAMDKTPRRSVEESGFARREWSPMARPPLSGSHSCGSIRDPRWALTQFPSDGRLNGRVVAPTPWTSDISLDEYGRPMSVSPSGADTESDESGLGQSESRRPAKMLPRQLSKSYNSVVKFAAFSSLTNHGMSIYGSHSNNVAMWYANK